jgi:hypothetical protein
MFCFCLFILDYVLEVATSEVTGSEVFLVDTKGTINPGTEILGALNFK